jgi:hypothetical protein
LEKQPPASYPLGLFFGPGQRREQQRRQDGDNRGAAKISISVMAPEAAGEMSRERGGAESNGVRIVRLSPLS